MLAVKMTLEEQKSLIEEFKILCINKNGEEAFKLLEEVPYLVEYRDENMNSLLHFAVSSADLDLIKYLQSYSLHLEDATFRSP